MARTGANGRKTGRSGVGGQLSAKVKPLPPSTRPKAATPKSRGPKARTASGKKADPATLAASPLCSQEGLRDRPQAAHRGAGRTPPSQVSPKQPARSTRVRDDDIRSYAALV